MKLPRIYDKRAIIELIKNCTDIHFRQSEVSVTENYIGDISDYGMEMDYRVLLVESTLAKFITLTITINNIPNAVSVEHDLDRWVVNSRYSIDGSNVVLSTTFPVIDDTYFYGQLCFAIMEIRNMINIIRYAR